MSLHDKLVALSDTPQSVKRARRTRYPGFGGVGIWTASVIVDKDVPAGIVCWTCAILWILLFLFQGYHFKQALAIFKSAGGVSAPLLT